MHNARDVTSPQSSLTEETKAANPASFDWTLVVSRAYSSAAMAFLQGAHFFVSANRVNIELAESLGNIALDSNVRFAYFCRGLTERIEEQARVRADYYRRTSELLSQLTKHFAEYPNLARDEASLTGDATGEISSILNRAIAHGMHVVNRRSTELGEEARALTLSAMKSQAIR